MKRAIAIIAALVCAFSILAGKTAQAEDLSWRVQNLEWKVSDLQRNLSSVERTTSNHDYTIRNMEYTLRDMSNAIDNLQHDVEQLQIGNPEGGASVDILAGRRLAELVSKDCPKAKSIYETLSTTEGTPKILLLTFKTALPTCFPDTDNP